MNGWATIGDLPGIMKYAFGWIDPIHIYGVGETQVTLRSLSDYPQFAVIHPHGDLDNPNWFIVEYLTSTNNNFGLDETSNIHYLGYLYPVLRPGGGLRIWRVSMNPLFFTADFGLSRWGDYVQPYVFIEAIHHHSVWDDPEIFFPDHFFYPGDSLTPYTEPSSNYARSFSISDDGSLKFIETLSCSGIYLENIQIKDDTAQFTVTIREND